MVKDESEEKADEQAAIEDRLALVSLHSWIRLIRAAALREEQQRRKSQNSGTSISLDRPT